MNRVKKIVIWGLGIGVMWLGNAQQGIEAYVPISPELELFYRYGNIDVNPYKGRLNFSVPIYTVKYGAIELPISINYNSNGIRVDEEAGIFGLGWHFDLGTVSQIILGKDDLNSSIEQIKLDYIKLDSPEYVYEPVPEVAYRGGWTEGFSIGIHDPLRKRFDKYTGSITPNTFSAVKVRTEGYTSTEPSSVFFPVNNNPYDISGLLEFNSLASLDSERDILSFNFLGHHVKAYLGNGVVKMTKERYSIKKIKKNDKGEFSWEVTDPNGIKYLFEHQIETWRDDVKNEPRWVEYELNGYKKLKYYKPEVCEKFSYKKRTSRVWKLTSIEDTNGNKIELRYKRLKPYKLYRHSSGQTIFMELGYGQIALSLSRSPLSYFSPSELVDKMGLRSSGYKIRSKEVGTSIGTEHSVLSEIVFGKNKVTFNSNGRDDHPFSEKMDKIIVHNGHKLVHKSDFKYSYFNANHSDENHKRLKLDKVITQGKTHSFGYYLPSEKLPDKNSNAFDYWGFYNGQDQNLTYINDPFRLLSSKQQDNYFESTNLTPLLNRLGDIAIRSAVDEYAQYGILNEINYPTGGKTQIEYELNSFDNYFFPDVENNRNFTNGKYQQRYEQSISRGYGLRVKRLKNFDKDSLVSITNYNYEGGKHLPYSVMYNNDPYRKIKLHVNSLTSGFKETFDSKFILTSYYKSSPYMDFLSENDGVGYNVVEKEVINHIDKTHSYKEVSYFFNNPLKSPREIFYNDSPSIKKGDIDLFGYGINTNAIENGKLSAKEYFNSSGKMIKRNDYFYRNINSNLPINYNVKFANTRTLISILPFSSNSISPYLDYIFFFYPLYMPQSVLEWEKETLYFKNRSIFSFRTVDYGASYFNSDFLPRYIYKRATSPYSGRILESTAFKYNRDYKNNIINRVKSKHIKKNGQTAVFEEFRYHPGTTNLREKETRIKQLYSGSSIKENYNRYIKGKPQEYTRDNIKSVYLYGYSKQYPIAKIENATFSEVARALGISESALENYNESHIGQINGLRAKKPEWMITTYTHIPLVGVKTVTDPRGRRTTYEYDGFNRLKHIKDHNGDILEAYDYHYKNE